jgi:regulator-associated protein of mTOR
VPVLRIRGPEQLPALLQMLLVQSQRLRALHLLARFLDLGAEACNLALVVGIHPYVSKLLQAASGAGPDVAPSLVFVWARVLCVDRDSQVGLVGQVVEVVLLEQLMQVS